MPTDIIRDKIALMGYHRILSLPIVLVMAAIFSPNSVSGQVPVKNPFDHVEDVTKYNHSKAELYREDFLQMRKALEEYHPALHDYTSEHVLDSLLDHYYLLIDSSINYRLFYQYISRVLEAVGCGHTKLWIPSAYWENHDDNFFPLQFIISGEKVFATGSFNLIANPPRGSELLTINGLPIIEIIDELKDLESSDGFIESFKTSSVERRFPKKYAMVYGFPEEFHIKYITPGDTVIQATTLAPATRKQVESVPIRGDQLSLEELKGDDAALLTINRFSYYREVDMFHDFIDSCFRILKERSISSLIIDLRGNDGGDPFCSYYLFSYLEREPVPYFADHYGKYDTLADPIPMADNHYTGKVYVLIDGNGFSTTGHFCGLLKYHDLVTFVGTDLGSTYTCTGNVKYLNLEHTRLILGTAKERRYSAAVKGMDPTIGIKPDYYIEISQQDIVDRRDGQLEFVLKLMQGDK